MHFPLIGAMQAPVDRARETHTRATATLSGPCTGARRRGLPTGHQLRPYRRGTCPD